MLVRILVGLVLAAVVVLMLIFGGWLQCVLFSLAAFACVFEIATVLHRNGWKSFAAPVYVFAFTYYPVTLYLGEYWLLLTLVLCVLFLIGERVLNKQRTTEQTFVSMAMLMYPMSLFLFIALTHRMTVFDVNRTALLMLFAVPCLCDMFAYFIGTFFGNHKLCPAISPKKTVEGSVGGLFGGMLGGMLVYFLQGIWIKDSDFSMGLIPLLLLGLCCGIVGQFGDLFASSIKRWCGVKDFGTIFPGHGGMLDRLDSILVCAPLVFLFFIVVNDKLTAFMNSLI